MLRISFLFFYALPLVFFTIICCSLLMYFTLLSIPHSPFNNLCSFLPSYMPHFFLSFFTLTLSCLFLFPVRQAIFCNSRSKPSNSCVSTEYMMKETAGLVPSLADIWEKVVKTILKYSYLLWWFVSLRLTSKMRVSKVR